jgi:O-6-methylguanine DNA methyltransferase
MASHHRYEVEGWGVGELWFEEQTLVWHELPSPVPRMGPGPRSVRTSSRACPSDLAGRATAYFAGSADDFADVPIELDGRTPFERSVIAALRLVPYGQTVTYGELAALAGRPNAQRAVGSVCARNAFPLVVPCHRVIAAGGLGPYGSLGSEYKRRLLALEDVVL